MHTPLTAPVLDSRLMGLIVQDLGALARLTLHGAQELCRSRGGRPGLPVPNKPYGFCGRKAALNKPRFPALLPNCAITGYATKGALLISANLSTDVVSALRKVWILRLWKQHSVQAKLQALVYDILPSTTAVFNYAIGSRLSLIHISEPTRRA